MTQQSAMPSGFPVLTLVSRPMSEFVAHWIQWYAYSNEALYITNIGRPITPARLRALFEWKNGGKLSKLKRTSIETHYVGQCARLRSLPSDTSASAFCEKFGGGPIWRIFLLHCWAPTRFPIYDQHVHRAMTFIHTGSAGEIAPQSQVVIRDYVERYLPFWEQFTALPNRNVDKALWAFGKFLKQVPDGWGAIR